jgi:hypothetical protein
LEQDYPPREQWCRHWHLKNKFFFQNCYSSFFNTFVSNLHNDEPSTAE